MKNLIKSTLLLLAFLLALSCEQQTEMKPMPAMTKKILESKLFKNLDVSRSSLILDEQPLEAPSKTGKAVAINFNGAAYKKLIGFLNEEGKVINVLIFEVESELTPDKISASLEGGNFGGTFVLQTVNNIHRINFKNSKPMTFDRISRNARTQGVPGCSGMAGVYLCIAQTIANSGIFSRAFCYIELPLCMAIHAGDCMYAGCPNGGV